MGVTDRLTCGIHGRVTGICHLCADERHNRDLTAALAAKERAEAMTHEHRSEFLGEIQRRVIELGGDPPYWPARNDIEAHDDVESAARMILELLRQRGDARARAEKAEAYARAWCDDFTKLEPELRRMVEFAKQCQAERDEARADRDQFRVLWERDSRSLSDVIGQRNTARTVAEDNRARYVTAEHERDEALEALRELHEATLAPYPTLA